MIKPEKESQIIGSSILPPVCGDAELFFEKSLSYGLNHRLGYLIRPAAPVLILKQISNRVKLVLEFSDVLQKQIGERQSAVIIDQNSSAYGFIAADMRFKKVDNQMPFLAARPFNTKPGRHNLHGHLDLDKIFESNDTRIKIDNLLWQNTLRNFDCFQLESA